jgi:transcriptional regulator with XRE-family HTH domain
LDYNRIKELLTEKHITMSALSSKSGMSRRGLYAAIDNETLTIQALEKIAEFFEVPITEFFGGADSKLVTDLNRKFYIIETIARDIRRNLHAKWKIINETPEEKIKREASFDLLLIAALESIIYFDTVPKTLAYYQEELREYEEKYNKIDNIGSGEKDQTTNPE